MVSTDFLRYSPPTFFYKRGHTPFTLSICIFCQDVFIEMTTCFFFFFHQSKPKSNFKCFLLLYSYFGLFVNVGFCELIEREKERERELRTILTVNIWTQTSRHPPYWDHIYLFPVSLTNFGHSRYPRHHSFATIEASRDISLYRSLSRKVTNDTPTIIVDLNFSFSPLSFQRQRFTYAIFWRSFTARRYPKYNLLETIGDILAKTRAEWQTYKKYCYYIEYGSWQ